MGNFLAISIEVNGYPHKPTILLLGIYPQEELEFKYTKRLVQDVPSSFVTGTKNWKPLRCPSTGEGILLGWRKK